MSGALAGVRVIELAHERTSFAGKLMGDMGADVIVVEPPGGHATRSYDPFLEDRPGPERSLYWWHYNTSKRGVTTRLDSSRGQALIAGLAAAADVLLEGEDPGRLASLGIELDTLRASNERLISVSITPFGSCGPRSEEQATDLTLLASGGPAWSCGYDDHGLPPVRGGGNQAFHTGAHYAAISVLVALLSREESGRGQHIDVNLHAAANVTTEAGSYYYLIDQTTVQRQTGRHAMPMIGPPSQALCADGRHANMGVGLRGPTDYAALAEWLETAGLAESFPSMDILREGAACESIDAMLARDAPELQRLIGAGRAALTFLSEQLPAYDVFVGGQERGIPLGIIYSPEEALDDPHHRARGFAVQVEHEDLGRTFTYPGAPYRFVGTPWTIQCRAPHVGEHNAEVWGSLGVSAQELDTLREQGVV